MIGKVGNKRHVALFGMPYLYQSNDLDFHMQMVKLGLKRGGKYITGLPNKAIVANDHEYYITDYTREDVFCRIFGIIPTYTVEDFVSEIRKGKGNEK